MTDKKARGGLDERQNLEALVVLLIREWRQDGRHFCTGLRPRLQQIERAMVTCGLIEKDSRAPAEVRIGQRTRRVIPSGHRD